MIFLGIFSEYLQKYSPYSPCAQETPLGGAQSEQSASAKKSRASIGEIIEGRAQWLDAAAETTITTSLVLLPGVVIFLEEEEEMGEGKGAAVGSEGALMAEDGVELTGVVVARRLFLRALPRFEMLREQAEEGSRSEIVTVEIVSSSSSSNTITTTTTNNNNNAGLSVGTKSSLR